MEITIEGIPLKEYIDQAVQRALAPATGPTLEEAIEKARVVMETDRQKVKDALTHVGAARVKEIPENKIQEFLDYL